MVLRETKTIGESTKQSLPFTGTCTVFLSVLVHQVPSCAFGFDESTMLQRIRGFGPSLSLGTSRQGPAVAQVYTSSRDAGLAAFWGWQETRKEAGPHSGGLCPPFPLPDQHWSDDIPSEAETELRMRQQAVVEAELELRASESEEEQPVTTPGHQERSKSVDSGETASRIPTESLQGREQPPGHRSPEGAGAGLTHCQPPMAHSSACCPPSPCMDPARGFGQQPFLCVLWSHERVGGTSPSWTQITHMREKSALPT